MSQNQRVLTPAVFYKVNVNRSAYGLHKKYKEVSSIVAVRNSCGKRVCDISYDRRMIVIELRGCITTITANPDGTLKIEHRASVLE